MEFLVYILYSYEHDKIYIGFTSDLINRMVSHNNLGKGHTTKFRPWTVIHVEFFDAKKDAMPREKALKAGQGRKWIHPHFNKEAGFISA